MTNRKNKPNPSNEISFSLPHLQNFSLDNGLNVLFIQKNKLPMIRLHLMVNAGSKFDQNDKKGLSYLTSLLLDEGADGMDALTLSDEFDVLGSNLGISTDNDLINVTLQSLSEYFERSLDLFSRVILKPNFDSADFQREKKKLITRILQSKDEPDFLADQIFDRIILGKENSYSFPVSGYEETVDLISLNDVKQNYNNFFTPSNCSLIVVGDIECEGLKSLLNKFLGGWQNNQLSFSLNHPEELQKQKIYLCHKSDSVQTEIRVGHLSKNRNQKDYFPRLLLNTILGGQFTSRINLNLRERNGYTYGATSRFQYYKDTAFFEASTSVGINNTANAIKEILFELNNIQTGIFDQELEFAKSSITKKFPLNFETYRQTSANLAAKILFNLPEDYFDKYIISVQSVSKADVENAAKEFIQNDKLSIVLVGDKNILLRQLEQLEIELLEVNHFGDII